MANQQLDNTYAIKRYTATFKHAHIEQAFNDQQAPQLRALLLFGMLNTMLVEVLAQVYNFATNAKPEIQIYIFTWRVALIIIMTALAVSLYRTRDGIKIMQLTVIALAVYLGYKIGNMYIHNSMSGMYELNLIGMIMILYFVLPLRVHAQNIIGLLYSIGCIWLWSPEFWQSPEYFYVLLWLVFAFIIGAVVSYRKNVEARQLFASNQAILHSNRALSASNQYNSVLVNVLIHEIINPLNALEHHIELFRQNRKEITSEYVHKMQILTQRATHVLRQWRSQEAQLDEKPNLQRDDLVALMTELCQDIKVLYPSVQIDHELPAQLPYVTFEARVLALAVNNIIRNALTHGKASHIRIQYRRFDTSIGVRIRDYGIGISEASPDDVFRKDYSSNDDKNGVHGLGLYISRELLLHTGGEIKVDSEPGKGTAFTIMLPVE